MILHDILLDLYKAGFRGRLPMFICDFLSDRYFKFVSGIYTLTFTHRRQVSHRVVFFPSPYLVSRLSFISCIFFIIISGRKNCFRIAKQIAREGRDVISVCCMKNDAGNVVSDADGMNNIWRKYMEKLLNVENDWDGEVDCPEVMWPRCLISEEEVAAAIKELKMGKAAGRTGVVSEMMKDAGGFGSRWMTDLINNIIKEGCIPDDWRKCILVPVYKGKGDSLVCGSYRAIKLLEQPMKVLERVLEKRIRCPVSIDNMQFGIMPGKGTTDTIFIMRQVQKKHQAREKKLYYAFVDLEKAFDRVPGEMVRWALRKLGVDEWLIHTVMALYTEACTVVRTDAGLCEIFDVKLGLHQGSVLSPLLFVAVMDIVSSETRNGLPSQLLYADDLVIMAPTMEQLGRRVAYWRLVCLAKD